MDPLPQRKTPVHVPVRLQTKPPPIVFLTICTAKKKPILANPQAHSLLLRCWREAAHWKIGRYVMMPDHVHMFCAPGQVDCLPLDRWVQFWKSMASKSWPNAEARPLWQKSFWDTRLRSIESYAEKWDYVRRNPVRAGLCDDPEMWPFQGEMNTLMWWD